MAALRFTGYEQALRAAGMRVDPDLVVQTGSYHRRDGEAAMRALLSRDERPDGVFCATDLLALGAMRAAYELGLKVPRDIAVVGFDGLEEGRYSMPALTTIEPDKQQLARVSVDTLLARIRARESGPDTTEVRDVTIPFALLVRESSV
jgi:DNA-binding LacI/PurR family transcriptional regulator